MIRLVLLILMTLMLGSAGGISAAHTAAREPILVYFYNVPPYAYVDTENGQPMGRNVELIKQVFTVANVPFELRYQTLRRVLREARKSARICAFSFAKSSDRTADFHWIGPITSDVAGIFTSPNGPIVDPKTVSLEALKKEPVLIISGGIIGARMKRDGFNLKEVASEDLALKALYAGRFAYIAGTQSVLRRRAEQSSLEPPKLVYKLDEFEFYMICSTAIEPSLIAELQSALETITAAD